ncbi:SLC26A/SulP transporter family protein [Nodosilinea sp. LEGE 07088]|uniref:SulP family inorganic anion transporter n=1 Tax=Nodosilinea sp. LEGE 07088 TaxID=2777968 RepID=UPI001881D419|nr:SulP family inorganic anion transporter [Nodosilinea sp. LEGE 07088]MBE9140526.1 SLC26A/SulP transporter family protein [Nodosilinea sp. LEGE 07088]
MLQSFLNRSSSTLVLQRLQEGLQPQVLLSSLAAGLVTGIIGVIRAISYASLIFSGALATHLPTGLGMTVVSTGITILVVALTSTLPGIIATPLAAPTTILAIMAAAIASELADAPPADVLSTVMVAIALSAMLTGALLLALGLLRQGERIRFVPYPVIGGFMAGTGWLLTKGFFQVSTDTPLTWATLPELGQPTMLARWLPGLGFAIALLLATRLWKQFWVMPLTLLVCAASFFAVLSLANVPLEQARAAGWLLGPFPESRQLWQPLTPAMLPQIHWVAIAHQTGSLLTVMFVSLLSLLLSNSSIELVVGRDLNLSQEMKAVGWANLASGLGGGMAGNQALPSTLLVHDIGASYRLTGLMAILPAAAVLALGSSFLSYLPKALLGSLLLYLGLSLLWQWLYQAYFKLPLGDYLTVWVTLILIDAVGFLQGIAVGFVITVVLFMVNYSQVDVAKQVFSGTTSHSNVERSPAEEALLAQKGSQIYALELQGFLFFGTANYLLNKVRDRTLAPTQTPQNTAADRPTEPLRYVVIDFRQVSGLDSSAVLTFNKILKLANKYDFTLVLTNLLPEFAEALERGQGLDLGRQRCQVFPDLDRGLEWCEGLILGQILCQLTQPDDSAPALVNHLTHSFLTANQAQQFMPYLAPHDLPAGYSIFEPGEQRPELYFIESGQVSVLLELDDGRTKRLQTCSAGHILGEMRFFDKTPLSSSVVTDTPSRVYSLSRETFNRMQQEAPDLVQALQKHIVEILCESLIRRGEQLRIMQ